MPDLFGAGTPAVVEEPPATIECDIAIVGSGMGGATTAWALRDSGARVLVLEQGDFLPREWQNWSPRDVHQLARYKNSPAWLDADGRSFIPGNYQYVGGNTKVYGATLFRLRETDFEEVGHHDGLSPAWPIGYSDLEPFYGEAERMYLVHGHTDDPTEPWRSTAFPFGPVPHEPPLAKLADSMRSQGLHPFSLPQAVDWRPGGRCVLCRTSDAYPCLVDGKGEADVFAMRPALKSPTVRLMTRAEVRTIELATSGDGVRSLSVQRDGQRLTVQADRFVVAGGAVNTAALLLRSGAQDQQRGVANSSDQVGRNYMAHVCTFVVGVRPGRDLHLVYHKTLGINDWYCAGSTTPYPLGNIQSLGKLTGPTIKQARRWVPVAILDWFTRRSVDFFAETEDLPVPDSRVVVERDGRIRLIWKPTNMAAHTELVKRLSGILRRAGYPLIFTQRLGIDATSHQCGTARMGDDPASSVVDRNCRAHDVANMWIIDGSVFPSSGAVNPALTIAANALRVVASGSLVA